MLPKFWEAMLCLQDFSDSISFLFIQGPRSTKGLLWFGPWTLLQSFLKEQIIFKESTTAKSKICLSETLSTQCRDLKNYRSVDRSISRSGPWDVTYWRCNITSLLLHWPYSRHLVYSCSSQNPSLFTSRDQDYSGELFTSRDQDYSG